MMKKAMIHGGLTVASIVLVLSFLYKTEKPISNQNQISLSILHQSNREGAIEPCGCSKNPYGGIDREANAIAMLKEKGHIFYVDSGNLFMKPGDVKVDHAKFKSHAIVNMLNEAGLEYFAPGPGDFQMGTKHLRDLQDKAKFRFLSTNVTFAGSPSFTKYAIAKKDGVRFAFLALSPANMTGEALIVEPPKAALAKMLPIIKRQSDVIVLLSQLDGVAEEQIAKAFPEINIIVGASPDRETKYPRWYAPGRTILVDTFQRGMRLGKLDLRLNLPIQGFFSDAEQARNIARLKQLEEANRKPEHLKRFKAMRLLDPIVGGSIYDHTLVNLDAERFGSPNKVTKLIQAHKEEVRQRALAD